MDSSCYSVKFKISDHENKILSVLKQILIDESSCFSDQILRLSSINNNIQKAPSVKDTNVLPPIWSLTNGKYVQKSFKKYLKQLSKANMTVFQLQNNYSFSIPKELAYCRFYPNLKVLNLSNNNIGCIEHLCKLNAPELQALYLDHNFIGNFRCVRHLCFSKLKVLNLENNRFISLKYMDQANFPLLNTLIIQKNYHFIQISHLIKFDKIPININLKYVPFKGFKQCIHKIKKQNFIRKQINLKY